MKEILEAFGSEAERKLCLSSFAKWPRMDSGDLSVNSRADSPSTPVILKESGGHTWGSEFEDFHPKPCDETVGYALHMSAAHSNGSHTGSSQVSFIISEEHQAPVWRTEHPLVPDTDAFKFSPKDYSGGLPTSARTYSPSSPVYKQPRKSLECASPGSCSFLTGSDEEGTQVQTSIGQTLAVALSSGRFDCTDDAVCVEGLCETWSQFAEVEEGNLEKKECDFSENILSTAVVSNPEEVVFGNLKEGEEKDKKSEIGICKSENVFTCGAETKTHENGVRETIICSPAKCVGGSILLDDMGKKTVHPEINNHGEDLSTTDPAVRLEIVNNFEWMHSYSGGTAYRLCFHSNTLQKVQESPDQSEQNKAWLCKEANEASCQSIAQTQACFVTINSSLDMNGNDRNCQPHFSPSITAGGTQHEHQPEDLNVAENKAEEVLHFLKDKKAVRSMEKLLSSGQQNQCITNQREMIKGGGQLRRNLNLLYPQPTSSYIYVMDISEEKEVVIDIATEETKAVGCKSSEMSVNNGVLMLAASGMSVCDANKKKQSSNICCVRQHRSEAALAEDGDQILALTVPSASDAVVPCQLDLNPSQNRHQSSTSLHHDRCSLLSLSVCSPVLGGFDTFEKIHLSSDDDDAFLSCIPPGPLKATPPPLPYMLVVESDSQEDLLLKNFSEEEVERVQINPEKSVNRSDCSTFIQNEASQISSVPERPKLLPDAGSACESSQSKTLPAEESPSCYSSSCCTEFDMTEPFSEVLKELNLFFDISSKDFPRSPSPDHNVTDPLERSTLEPTQYLNNPEADNFKAPSIGEGSSFKMCEHDPADAVSSDTEQEVPLNTHLSQDVSTEAPEKHTEPEEAKRKTWSSSFMYLPFSEQASHRSSESTRRLEPLKTCSRPIRVGLSKRAKTKHLHRSHPY